jgi:phenylacetate-CoA ligase
VVIGPGVGCECLETKDGPVSWEDHVYPEVIDPITGRVLPDGEEGELVFTSLTKEALPIVRYRTRDPRASCCRRPGRCRIARIRARTDDMLIIRGVNVLLSQIEEQILRRRAAVAPLRARGQPEAHLDLLAVRVEAQAATAATPRGSRRRATSPIA